MMKAYMIQPKTAIILIEAIQNSTSHKISQGKIENCQNNENIEIQAANGTASVQN